MTNAVLIHESYPQSSFIAPEPPVTYRGVVCAWHLDHMGHMNAQHYAAMFDHASWVVLALLGLDGAYFRENHRGMAALEQSITYKHELRAGDTVEISSAVLELRDKTIRLFHEMRKLNSDIVAAHTTILGVHLDTDTRKSLPLPPAVRQRVCDLMVFDATWRQTSKK